MKVLVKRENNGKEFKLSVDCKYAADSYGFSYGSKADFCGSTLEVSEQDIMVREWSKYPDISGKDYGVICPVCGGFVVIDKTLIPKGIRESCITWNEYKEAEEIYERYQEAQEAKGNE